MGNNIPYHDVDDNYIAYQKPHGLRFHDGTNLNNLVTLVNIKFGTQLRNVNQIDMGTGGVAIFAKNKEAAVNISTAFAEKDIEKYYVALVKGKTDHSVVENYLKSVPTIFYYDRQSFWEYESTSSRTSPSNENDPDAKYAKLEVWPLEYGELFGEDVTLIKVRIYTGITHQIRAQMANEGHPIIGDELYGDREINTVLKEKTGFNWFLLWAYEYKFENYSFSFDYEPCWTPILEKVQWEKE